MGDLPFVFIQTGKTDGTRWRLALVILLQRNIDPKSMVRDTDA